MISTTDLTRELLYQIRLGEDSAYEFKSLVIANARVEQPHRDSVADELAAFANASGGNLVLGVHDKTRKVEGIAAEWRLAQVLEDDDAVRKWMKPAPGQFRIEWSAGRNYEPDFVVEADDRMLLIEPKRADEVDDAQVQAKARAAVRWCGYANEQSERIGAKRWHYLLVPHDAVVLGSTVAGLQAEHERR